LVLKTASVVEVLRTALAPLADRIQVAFVYGSVARAEPKAGSDISGLADDGTDIGTSPNRPIK
jgi:predicted nucleotidyltransferase